MPDFLGGVDPLLRERVRDLDLDVLLLLLRPPPGEGTVWSGVEPRLLIGLGLSDFSRLPLLLRRIWLIEIIVGLY